MSLPTGPLLQTRATAIKPSVQNASILVLVLIVIMFTVGTVLQALHFEAGSIITEALFFLLPALIYLKMASPNPAAFARFKPLQLKYIPTIIMLAVSTWLVLIFFEAILLSNLMELGYEPLEEIPPPETLGQLLLYILVIAVTPGVCEEVIFRGAVLPSAEQHGMVPALLFSSLLFGMMHMSLLSFFSTFVLGLMFGLVVIKTGSIYGGMLFHTLNNLIAVFSMYYSNRFEMDTQIAGSEDAVALAWLAITGLSFAAMIGGLFLLQRQSRVNPLLPSRRGFLPRGWINWASVLIAIIFIGAVAFELLLGFGFFDFLETLPAPQ